MSRGLINPELPYINKKAVEMVKPDYPNREAAGRHIVEGIENCYRTTYPEVYNGKRALVEQWANNVAKIYLRNFGTALFNAGKFQDAAASYREAVRLSPAFAHAHYNLGMALLRLNDTKSA